MAHHRIALAILAAMFVCALAAAQPAAAGRLSASNTFSQTVTLQDSITGKVFHDLNGNGSNNGEPGLSGWTIELHSDSTNGTLVQSVTSDSNGLYKMFIPKGNFVLTEVLPAGWVKTRPGVPGFTITTSNTSITGFNGRDFGNFLGGVVRIELTVDRNGDGIRGAEDTTALPGGTTAVLRTRKGLTTVRMDTLGNGVSELALTNLVVGTYTFDQVARPAGWVQTHPIGKIVISQSGQVDTAEVLDFQLTTASGRVYHDQNTNGVDDGEPGLSGWSVELWRDTVAGSLLQTKVTDANGNYQFDSLSGGQYYIREVDQAAWIRTQPANTPMYLFSITSGTPVTGNTFGHYLGGAIHGQVFYDRNENGVQDPGEDGLTGWTITASNADPSKDRSAVSQPGGGFAVVGLLPGTYTLTQSAKTGWTPTCPVGGSYTVIAGVGSDTTGLTFGNQGPVVDQLFRTFVAESFALKPVKKKSALTRWVFSLQDSVSKPVNGVYIKLTNAALSMDSVQPALSMTQVGPKEWVFSGDSIPSGTTVRVYGTGPGRPMAISKWAWLNNTTRVGKIQPRVVPDTIQYLAAMPNAANVTSAVFTYGFAPFNRTVYNGMVLGTRRLDSARTYGWGVLKTADDVRKSLLDKTGFHTGSPRGFSLYSGRAWTGQKLGVPPSKHNNTLVAKLIALKISIAASAYGITPTGLGELVYEEGTNPLSGLMLKDIVARADSFLTYWQGRSSDAYLNLDTTIGKLNATFSAPMDTIRYWDTLRVPGVASIAGIPWLRPTPPGVHPLIILNPAALNEPEIPQTYTLAQNYPNPFNPQTTIEFGLPAAARVSIVVYNILGQQIQVLMDREELDEGAHNIDFMADGLPSGVYFYRMTAEPLVTEESQYPARAFISVKKMLLVR